MIKRVLLDLDCVLADFIGGVCKLWGFPHSTLMASWTPGEYPMNAAIGKVLGRSEPISNTEFWDAINNKVHFWEDLEPLPWWKALVELARAAAPEFHVVTSPSLCISSYDGKVRWLKRVFGEKFTNFAITPHKEMFAQPDVVLIDDHGGNVDNFIKAGGKAILFPVHHNADHACAACCFTTVQRRLAYLSMS